MLHLDRALQSRVTSRSPLKCGLMHGEGKRSGGASMAGKCVAAHAGKHSESYLRVNYDHEEAVKKYWEVGGMYSMCTRHQGKDVVACK